MTPAPTASYATLPPKLVGGALCVDFVNTVSWRGRSHASQDRLTRYDELVYWAWRAGALGRRERDVLLREGREHPERAARALAHGVELREATARLLQRSGRGRDADLALLNGRLARAPERSAVEPDGQGYRWASDTRPLDLESPLWPIVRSLADLLTSDDLARVHSCGDPECGWLFVDASRAGRRRWCAMDDCGNRNKARRHYARVK